MSYSVSFEPESITDLDNLAQVVRLAIALQYQTKRLLVNLGFLLLKKGYKTCLLKVFIMGNRFC